MWSYHQGVPVLRLEHMYSDPIAPTLPTTPNWLWSVAKNFLGSIQSSVTLPRKGGQETIVTNKFRAPVSLPHPQPVDLGREIVICFVCPSISSFLPSFVHSFSFFFFNYYYCVELLMS